MPKKERPNTAKQPKTANLDTVIKRFTRHYSGKYNDQSVVPEHEREKRIAYVGDVVDS
jgi:hypothetical protein